MLPIWLKHWNDEIMIYGRFMVSTSIKNAEKDFLFWYLKDLFVENIWNYMVTGQHITHHSWFKFIVLYPLPAHFTSLGKKEVKTWPSRRIFGWSYIGHMKIVMYVCMYIIVTLNDLKWILNTLKVKQKNGKQSN